jgi:hypothetical protein
MSIEKQWVGITKRTLNEFIKFLDDLAEDSILEKDYVAKMKASINKQLGDTYDEKYNRENCRQT